MCYFSGLQVHVGEDSYSYAGEVMQCCKTATQHCREAEDLCSSFNLDVAKDSVITCNQVISLSFKTWSRCLKSNENLVTVLGSTAHRRMFLHIFQKSTLDASSKGEGSDIYIYLSLVLFQAFWVTFFMAGTRQWLVPEMYFVHVQAVSVQQPFQCCKFNFLNSQCFLTGFQIISAACSLFSWLLRWKPYSWCKFFICEGFDLSSGENTGFLQEWRNSFVGKYSYPSTSWIYFIFLK